MSGRLRKWMGRLAEVREGFDRVMGINRRNLELVRKLNERKDFPLADDKILAKEMFAEHGIPCAPTLATFEAIVQLADFPAVLGVDSCVLKPARGRGGNGILVVDRAPDGGWVTPGERQLIDEDVRRHGAAVIFGAYSLGAQDRLLVEQRLRTDAALAELSPVGLPDIRVVVVDDVPRLAMLRLATHSSDGRANLHQGGVGVGINLETGRTTLAARKGRRIEVHPDTGAPLVDVPVPAFREIVEVATAAARACPLGFLGVDLTVDAELGVVVLELNARPGLEIQVANGVGLRGLLDA